MLAACRTQQNPDVQPNFALTSPMWRDLDQLPEFHQALHSCFVCREPREHFLHYMAGQLSALERRPLSPWRFISKAVTSEACHASSAMMSGKQMRCGRLTMGWWPTRWVSPRACSFLTRVALQKRRGLGGRGPTILRPDWQGGKLPRGRVCRLCLLQGLRVGG